MAFEVEYHGSKAIFELKNKQHTFEDLKPLVS